MKGIKKITVKGTKITIQYTEWHNTCPSEYTVTSFEEARPEFYDAMTALASCVAVVMDMTEIRDITERLIPYGLTVSKDMNGAKKVRFLCRFLFPELKAETTLISPLLTEYTVENRAKAGRYLSKTDTEKVNQLIHEAVLYAEGKRAQMSLWNDGADQHVEPQIAEPVAAAPAATRLN